MTCSKIDGLPKVRPSSNAHYWRIFRGLDVRDYLIDLIGPVRVPDAGGEVFDLSCPT